MYQVLVLLKDKGFSQFNVRQLDRYMRNIGNQQFDYETFKVAYDSDNKIKSIVKDFDKETITLKTSGVDNLKTTKHKKKNTVSNMAKKAVDLKGL